MKLDSVCPIIVLYGDRNNEEAICEKLNEISKVFVRVVVVDNNKDLSPALCNLGSRYTVIHNKNVGGLAGAYNAALRIIYSRFPTVKRILFMDDDTSVDAYQLYEYVDKLLGSITQKSAAAITGWYWDLNSSSGARYLHCTKWTYKRINESSGVVPVTFIINSMALWDISALRRLGFFNETLGVDHIDTEMCVRASEAGLKLYADLDLRFDHTIGDRIVYAVFGVRLNSGNHSPQRRYSIGRTTAFLLRSRFISAPSISFLMLQRLLYEVLGICIAEQDRFAKLVALLRGVAVGLTLGDVKKR